MEKYQDEGSEENAAKDLLTCRLHACPSVSSKSQQRSFDLQLAEIPGFGLLVGGFEGQIVQENEAQADFRAAERGRQVVERIRGANRGNGGAVERFLA